MSQFAEISITDCIYSMITEIESERHFLKYVETQSMTVDGIAGVNQSAACCFTQNRVYHKSYITNVTVMSHS